MKNLTVTVNGVAYNVTVEENTNGAAPVAAAPAAAPAPAAALECEPFDRYGLPATHPDCPHASPTAK